MAIIKVNLTRDMLTLISNITFSKVPDLEQETPELTWGLDFFSLYGGVEPTFENISYLLGIYDKHIEGTEEEPLGAKFPPEVEQYMWELHTYILDHIGEIEEIVHQFCARGGISEGTYRCRSNEHIWEKVD